MTQSKAYTKARDLLAQNSALLAAVNDAPGKPQEFGLTAGQDHHQLPVDRERQLSEDFAFLAARKKDPTKVMAVAIEEDQDRQGMTIRVAVNQGDLSVVKDGLTRIAQVMQRASTRAETRHNLQPQLLQDIITLDYPRILSRLRSKHAPSSGQRNRREPIMYLLNQHIHNSVIAPDSNRTTSYKSLQKLCNALVAGFDRLEALQSAQAGGKAGCKIVSEILQRIAELIEKFDIPAVLRTSKDIEPNLLESLPLSLIKLARYYKLSHALIEAARDSKYTIFKIIRVATLDANNFAKTSIILKKHTFDEVLSRFKTKKTNPQVLNRAREKPWNLAGETTNPWRVHAEIQLLSFYQFQKTSNAPRFLSASKSSCYLCCLFIRAHGRFQVPRTHGRLYSQWTLPDIPNNINSESFLRIIQQVNQQLEIEIRKALMGPVRKIIYPSESVAAVNLPWSAASTMMVLAAADEGSAMPSIVANLPLPKQDGTLIAEVLPENRDADLEGNGFESRSQTPRAAAVPELNEKLIGESAMPNQIVLSLSTGDNVCLNVTSNWLCHKLSSPSQGIWCLCDGLDLFLSLESDDRSIQDTDALTGFSTDHQWWLGIKSTLLTSEPPTHKLDNCFNVARLDFAEHVSDAGAALSNMPLILTWLDRALILKFAIGNSPEDPLPAN